MLSYSWGSCFSLELWLPLVVYVAVVVVVESFLVVEIFLHLAR